jgi:tryptophan synthase beta subunit
MVLAIGGGSGGVRIFDNWVSARVVRRSPKEAAGKRSFMGKKS